MKEVSPANVGSESIMANMKPKGKSNTLGMAGSKGMRGGKITMATGKMSSKMSKVKRPNKGGAQLY